MTATSPLPENMMYNCSFSAPGDKFTLVVPAIEMVAGTKYQCNIANVATFLDSVKQGMVDTNLKKLYRDHPPSFLQLSTSAL